MPFAPAQNELDIFPIFSMSESTFQNTSATETIFAFRTKSALTLTDMTFTYDGSTGTIAPTSTLEYGPNASGDVLFSTAPTGANLFVAGVDTTVPATSGYNVVVPRDTPLAVSVVTTSAGDAIFGLHIEVTGRRYNA